MQNKFTFLWMLSNILGIFISITQLSCVSALTLSQAQSDTSLAAFNRISKLYKVSFFNSAIANHERNATKFDGSVESGINFDLTSLGTLCPEGFVVPDDPLDNRIVWIPGTGCANQCRAPLYTDSQFGYINSLIITLNIISIPCCAVVMSVWFFVPNLRGSVYVFYLGAILLIASCVNLGFGLMDITEGGSSAISTSTCANNAVGLNYEDGSNNTCGGVSFVNIYCIAGAIVAWFLYFLDLYLTFAYKDLETIQKYFNSKSKLGIMILAPFIWVILWGTIGLWGFPGGAKYCLISFSRLAENVYDLPILFGPLTLTCFLTFALYFRVLLDPRRFSPPKILPSSIDESSRQPSGYQLILPGCFLMTFGAMFLYLIGYRFAQHQNTTPYTNAYIAWIECVFTYFYYSGGSNDVWKAQCGTAPAGQVSIEATAMFYVSPNILPVIFSVLFIMGAILYKMTGIDIGVIDKVAAEKRVIQVA